MPTASRARALLSAKPPCRLPRVAVHANASAATTTANALPHRRAPKHRPHKPAVAARSFHTSSPARGRPDDPNPGEPPADPKSNNNNGAAEKNGQPAAETAAQQAAETRREKLRIQGYGSARARASRNRADDLPAVELPSWFVSDHVSLYESRPIGSPSTLLFPLEEEDREKVLALLDSYLDRAAVSEADVEACKDRLLRSGKGSEGFEKLVRRFRAVHNAAFLQALALVHHPSANPDHIERLREHHSAREEDIMRLSWWSDESLSGDAQRWLSNLRSDSVPGSGALHGSPLANRPDPEYQVCMELLAAVRSQLMLPNPIIASRQDLRRPVTVLSVLNRKGRSVAESVINDIATDLKADAVHLDAYTIASLVGKHLGQNLYSSRGAISMLGYAAAEMNGRLAPRPDADSEHELGMVAVALPSRLRSLLSPKDGLLGSSDGRWEDMKIGAALDAIIAAADVKRTMTQSGLPVPEQDLIVHVHDYVELSALYPAIIARLRTIVDRMWMAGRRAVLVGSSSGDMSRSTQWRDQLLEIGRDGGHIIPFHASETSEWMEAYDNFHDNISNIEDMLQAMLGNQADVTFRQQIRVEDGRILVNSKYDSLVATLSSHLYDAQWVYRLASLMVGSRTPRFQNFGLGHLQYALDFMADSNKHWSNMYPGIRPPYFSPLFTSRSSSPSFMSSAPDDWPPSMSGPTNLSGDASSKEYDQHEKKLLSGLINAKDIHTTFNDIVVPQETKESLIGLTSLSLIRPDAFSYGVLKTERIPGCLLYGPPGTGKTLLAKAVAKESGANMLEVSAASINDMWLGQSEKNVRALFSLARKLSPAVIFLDEADALLGARHSAPGRSTAHRETITQFLREWDGLTSDMRAFIMVATNRPFDLDEAVLRRLPRKILVDLPLRPDREAILRVMLRDERLAPDVDLARLAAETELYSGSDLKNLCVSAAMEAVREECRMRDEAAAAAASRSSSSSSSSSNGGGDEQPSQSQSQFQFPERRVLAWKHFDKGLREISASISEDMDSLKAIRRFDEQYGDAGRKKRGRRSIGFEVVPGRVASEEARVRQVV
ncbi:hypothetical protein VTK56DRAFT_532 [Thermocarpiscus australiensis]